MDMEKLFENTPAKLFRVEKRKRGVYQLIAPLFHDDGDMMTIFLQESEDGRVKISDEGMSLMRLSYTFEIDTDGKRKILNDIILNHEAEINGGNISMVVDPKNIYPAILTFAQIITQVCNMEILSRETISSLFYDNLESAIGSILPELKYERNYRIPNFADFQVDFAFLNHDRPVYLFGVRDTNKAQQATICCLQLAKKNFPFRSIAVFENMDNITRFARNNMVNTVGKVFSDIDGFLENGHSYFEKELALVH